MDVLEKEKALQSYKVLIDTREQITPHFKERCQVFDSWERRKLEYGDYAATVLLPNGCELYAEETSVKATAVIERKQSLDELAMCFTRGRDRFRREFERATEAKAKTFLLIEGGSWEAIYKHRYRSKFNPEAFAASLEAWSIRYDLTPIFCKPETSGRLIKELLYRQLKHQLETGVFG